MIALSRRSMLRSMVAVAGAIVFTACNDSTGPETPALFSTTYVFGASLEDTGNRCNLVAADCRPAPYATGRESNGPLYVDVVASAYGAPITPSRTGGTNYAHSGARTGPIVGAPTTPQLNMIEQVDRYLAATNANPGARERALFIVGGTAVGNDITAALTLGATNPQAPGQIITAAVTNIGTIINRLYAAGARNILLLNSTDVGRTPLARSLGAQTAGVATLLSTQFNTGLAATLPGIRTASPGLNLYLVDVGAFTNEVFASPTTFGFTNSTAPCLNTGVTPPTACATPDSYFFWDVLHPTAAASRLLGQRAIGALPTIR
ncbi:MAG TPA: SGNH/GDSL hydrolase family protein [Gemmatimonas sp.]|nr:SGNH/GDSL hydrolase family protein [Gemmatimonas sp.]